MPQQNEQDELSRLEALVNEGGGAQNFQPPTQDGNPSNLFDRFVSGAREATFDFLHGVGQGGTSTVMNISKMLGMVPEDTTLQDIGIQPSGSIPEKAGFMTEQVGEFFVPGSLAKRVPQLGALLSKQGMAGTAARTAIEGVGAGAVSFAQTRNPQEAFLDASIDAAFTAGFGAAGPLLNRASRRSMLTAINPSVTDRRHGFDVDNIFKHNISGATIPQMARNATTKRKELGQQLAESVAQHGDVRINVLDLLGEAVDDIRSRGTRFAAQITDLDRAQNRMMEMLQNFSDDGTMGLVDAQGWKQAVGELGAWAEGVDQIDNRALELLSNTYYTKLREAIEVGAPEVVDVNRALSEVIPIEQALIRRLPTAEKARLFELGELVLISGVADQMFGASGNVLRLGTGVAGLLLMNRILRTPSGSRGLRALSSQGLGPGIGRIMAGINQEVVGEQQNAGSVPTIGPR